MTNHRELYTELLLVLMSAVKITQEDYWMVSDLGDNDEWWDEIEDDYGNSIVLTSHVSLVVSVDLPVSINYEKMIESLLKRMDSGRLACRISCVHEHPDPYWEEVMVHFWCDRDLKAFMDELDRTEAVSVEDIEYALQEVREIREERRSD